MTRGVKVSGDHKKSLIPRGGGVEVRGEIPHKGERGKNTLLARRRKRTESFQISHTGNRIQFDGIQSELRRSGNCHNEVQVAAKSSRVIKGMGHDAIRSGVLR